MLEKYQFSCISCTYLINFRIKLNIVFCISDLIRAQDKEIEELKMKIAQVLAVMPTDTFSPSNPTGSSKLLHTEDPTSTSNLDPNATAYTPKASLVTSTEA